MKTFFPKTPYLTLLLFIFVFSCGEDEALPPVDQAAGAFAGKVAPATVSQNIRIQGGHYLIIAATSELPSNLGAKVADARGQLQQTMPQLGLATASSTDPNFAQKASKIPGIRSVIPDLNVRWFDPSKEKRFYHQETGTPPASGDDDERFDLQWGHTAIQAPQAWNAGYRGAGAKVAVLDGGFDLEHPDLQPNILHSASFVPGEGVQYAYNDPFSHGTHVAGTIAAADNGIGTIGVAPEAQLILAKVLTDDGWGEFSWVIQGILYAVEMEADIINMSLGEYLPHHSRYVHDNGTPDDPSDDFIVNDTRYIQEALVAINRATTYAYQQEVTVIASAGNDGINGDRDKDFVHTPSDAPNVISISATAPIGWAANPSTDLDVPTFYTNYGVSVIDFAAPGGSFEYPFNDGCTISIITRPCWVFDLVYSTGSQVNGQPTWYWSAGTSMAAPHAAGVAALIIGKHGGDMHPAQVKAALKASADDLGKPGKDALFGHGRVNAFRAVLVQ